MSLVWPLTGRAEELGLIRAALGERGGSGGVVIAGSAGVGKTRLAREALDATDAGGRQTRWLTASESARGLPLGAFSRFWKGAGGDQLQVFRDVMASLVEGSPHDMVVVGVDDAHLLDEQSAFLVHQVVHRRLARVLLTQRTGETAPHAITALWKDRLLDRLELQPLSAEETLTLMQAVLGGPVDADTAQRMWSLTQGNALFMRHVMDEELATGRLFQTGGGWRWRGEPVVSAGLADLISSRMDGVDTTVADVLDLLAIGEPLDLTLLGQLTDPLAIEEAEMNGLVTLATRSERVEVRLAHPLYGEVRRAHLGRLRGRRLRGAIANGLAANDRGTAEQTLRQAVLALDSDLPPDPALFVRGAQCASQLLDLILAEKLVRAAARSNGGYEVQVSHAFALSVLSRGQEAEDLLAALTSPTADDDGRARGALVRAGNLFWDLARPLDALHVLAEARRTITDRRALNELDSLQAAFDAQLGHETAAIDTARRLLNEPGLSDLSTMMAIWALVLGWGCQGKIDDARSLAERGYTLAARSGQAAYLRFGLCHYHVAALRLAGFHVEALAVADRIHRECADVPGAPQLFTASLNGHAALGAGDLAASCHWFRPALAGLVAIDESPGWLYHSQVGLIQALAISGEVDAAASMLHELERRPHPAFVFLDPDVLLARAWVAAGQGAVSQATRLAHGSATRAAELGAPAAEVVALHTAARFGDHTVAARLDELSSHVDGPRAPIAAAYARALADDDADALRSASEAFEHIGDRLAATDAAAQAASVYLSKGLRGSALGAAARAQRLATQCGAARTPALIDALHPSPLSSREREIATLAARGLSNRQIAEQLVLSVRTVEGHLYRATAKLGGVPRTRLPDVLAPEFE